MAHKNYLSIRSSVRIIISMKICEKCNEQHDGTYASGRFCSAKCSRAFSTFQKRKEVNEKVSKTMKGRKTSSRWKNQDVIRSCKYCNATFEAKRPHQLACSRECVRKNHEKALTEEQKIEKSKVMSLHAKRRHELGDKIGWTTRSNLHPSYPEKVAINFLDSRNVCYIRELPVGRYFVDFAIEESKIAIEIDGQQHLKPERLMSDKKKDELLKQKGWKVFRIKWPNDNVIESIKTILNLS